MAGPRPPRSREQLRAAVILGVLVLLSIGIWAVAALTTGPDTAREDVFAGIEPNPEPPDTGSPSSGPSDAPESDDHGAADDDGAVSDGDGTDRDGSDDGGDGTTERIDFDGVCVVEVEGDLAPEERRPWRFDACERAPITLEGTQERWVAIVASLSGDDFTEAEALQRIDGDDERLLLWSSHYPSLNPGLWVIVEGPFEDRAAATNAAQRLGGGAYPRALTDDDDDRYCVAADGCVGETRP